MNEPLFASCPEEKRLELLIDQIGYAKKSPFYRERLGNVEVKCFDDLKKLPYMSSEDIRSMGHAMVCVPGSRISRIVSLTTSGTSGAPKRIRFTEGDIGRTVDFFADGMSTMCRAGDTAVIMMNCTAPSGVGELLSRGLSRIGVRPIPLGAVSEPWEYAQRLRAISPEVIVGLPWQVRLMSLLCPELRPGTVLLSGDYVPEPLPGMLHDVWGCEVLTHFGMTETCYGCAVGVKGYDGMLLRTDELFAEVTEEGELCLTTLRREAMPLIRYRTGDLVRLSDDGRRILKVSGRMDGQRSCREDDRLCAIPYLYDTCGKTAEVSDKLPESCRELLNGYDLVVREPENAVLFTKGKRFAAY